ncbi:MAG: MBL fold metallo-hydrolase [Clostridia bacterium]|nr:MBL fold metallo-hydrolase [Clostridia bacterium]
MHTLSALTPYITRLTVPFLDIYTTIFVVKTEQGAVVFDTATYPEDMDTYLVPALEKLGIGAEDLKYVVLSHNHRDHAGGLARFAELFPGAAVAAGSRACEERIPDRNVTVLKEGDTLLDVLQVVALPGHTADCIGLLDTRTGTLLSGDGLQLFGIYGSGAWGANISYIKEHLALGKTLGEKKISVIAASHDYHPCGWKAEGEAVGPYIAECAAALRAVADFARANPDDSNEELAARYNASSGLPTVGAHVFAAVRNAMAAGEM